MKTFCQHPKSDHFVQLHPWHSAFCKGDPCAAMLLAHFSSWHKWKLRHDQYYRRFNDIAEMHGDGRPHNQNAYLFFTMDELVSACLNFFGKQAIRKGIELLVGLKVISVHKNPNPRYHFDKTKYFRFYPEAVSCWEYQYNDCEDDEPEENNAQAVDNFDDSIADDGKVKSERPPDKNRRPSCEGERAITDNTNNTTNNNQSTRAREEIDPKLEKKLASAGIVQPIISALIAQGMPAKRFYSDALDDIHHLSQVGATVDVFLQAYDLSLRATQGREFGVPYLIKVVKDLLANKRPANRSAHGKDPPRQQAPKDRFSETVYESDIRNALKWMKDEVPCEQQEQK